MLLSVLLQAAAAGVGVVNWALPWVLVWLLSVQVWVLARLVVLPWKPLHASRKHREIFV